jgi:hypothetical protein
MATFHYFMHLQFKFTFSRKIQVNKINSTNIAQSHKKSQIETCACIQYIRATKKFEIKIQKKIFVECLALPSARQWHSAKQASLPSAKAWHSTKACFFAKCQARHSAIF